MDKKNRDLLLAAIVIILIGWLVFRYVFVGPTPTTPSAPVKQEKEAKK